MRIVLDTNCLIAALSRKSPYYNVWYTLNEGAYTLCVSNEILEEYEEIIALKTNSLIASNVIQMIINCQNVELVDPHFHFNLVREDYDDNKFVDCAIVANATYIVSNDKHFNSVKECNMIRTQRRRGTEFDINSGPVRNKISVSLRLCV